MEDAELDEYIAEYEAERLREIQEADETFCIAQLTQRLSRKRTLELLQQVEPDAYAAVQGTPLLRIIASDGMLALLLSRLWKHCFTLALVCKRFKSATHHRNFWMPAVRKKLIKISVHAALKSFVNPFFVYPAAMFAAPRWPWWTYLQWLFCSFLVKCSPNSLCLSSTYTTLKLEFQCTPLELCMRTFCYEEERQESGTKLAYTAVQTIAAPGSPHLSHCSLSLQGNLVWYDGPLKSGRIWCGGVTSTAKGNVITFEPIEGAGHWK
jgi:hypothetical protein